MKENQWHTFYSLFGGDGALGYGFVWWHMLWLFKFGDQADSRIVQG